jgi:putative redox protein
MRKKIMENKAYKGTIKLIDDGVKFDCAILGKEPIMVDYFPPLGTGEGYTSLQLLLLSLGSCLATTVKVLIVNKLQKKVDDLTVSFQGGRREEHPTVFSKIRLEIGVSCAGLKQEALDNIIEYGKQSICPVLAMINSGTDIKITGCIKE